MPFDVLVTSRSFSATPGAHHDHLGAHGCRVHLDPPDRPYGPEALQARVPGHDGVILGLDAFDAAVAVAAAPRLRVVSRFGTGVDNVDLDAATRHGIVVTNTPGANARSVAELSLGLMVALARGIPRVAGSVAEGRPARSVGRELGGKVLGLLGYGAVGRLVADFAGALGMRVRVHDPYATGAPSHVERVSKVELLADADVLSLHAALTPETRGVLDAGALARMKDGALLVNTARAELMDAGAVLAALRTGRLGGVAIDEAIGRDPTARALLAHEQVIATPHVGASTHEAILRTSMMAAENLVAVLTGTPCRHVVNPAAREEEP